jgi:hypothetical protein
VTGQTEPVDLTDRALYGHWSRDKVRWGDQDGMRHINNVAYAGYLENARTELIIERVIAKRPRRRVLQHPGRLRWADFPARREDGGVCFGTAGVAVVRGGVRGCAGGDAVCARGASRARFCQQCGTALGGEGLLTRYHQRFRDFGK